MDPSFAKRYLRCTRAKLGIWSRQDPDRRFGKISNWMCSPEHLLASYCHVSGKRSSRTAGIDHITLQHIQDGVGRDRFLANLRDQVRDGYEFSPVRIVTIETALGGHRTVGIPTFADRVVEFVFLQLVDAIVDPHMSDRSFGFRLGGGPGRAVEAAVQLVADPRVVTVLEADVSRFFPSIRHADVTGDLCRLRDPRMLGLLEQLKGRAPLGEPPATRGLVVGCSSSPLLANLVANAIDRFLEQHGAVIGHVRYADDLLIGVAGDITVAEQVRAELDALLNTLGLQLAPAKTFVRRVNDVAQCLGHDICRTTDGIVALQPSPSRIQRLRSVVEAALTKEVDRSTAIIKAAAKARGWSNYYQPHHLAEVIANAILWEAIERSESTPFRTGVSPGPSPAGSDTWFSEPMMEIMGQGDQGM